MTWKTCCCCNYIEAANLKTNVVAVVATLKLKVESKNKLENMSLFLLLLAAIVVCAL